MDDLQARLNALWSTAPAPERPFSPYLSNQAADAGTLAGQFMALADAAPDARAGWAAVLDAAEGALGSSPPAMVQYAVQIFLAHHPLGAALQLPALESRASAKVGPAPPPTPRSMPMPTIEEVQQATVAFFTAPPAAGDLEAAPFVPFSEFDPAQLRRALDLAARFMALADQQPGAAGLDAVVAAANEAARTENPDLVKYALMVFITHHPEGSRLPIPPLEERAPAKLGRGAADGALALEGASGPEMALDWYREDVFANAHHEHWHVVYPSWGIPLSGGGFRLKDRQGELFYYMHQQMLARYDTERLGVGLPVVRPLADYGETLAEGYDPGLSGFSARPAGRRMSDLARPQERITLRVGDLAALRDRLLGAVESGLFGGGGRARRVTLDLLGAAAEASAGSPNGSFYGNHHGLGHVLLSFAADPRGSTPPGVMWDTATAIRDPIFYRWHRHVDDVAARWQDRQPANRFADAPPVRLRKGLAASPRPRPNTSPDLILAFQDQIPGAEQPGFNGGAWATTTFGGANWDRDFSTSAPATAVLQTTMSRRTLPDGRAVDYLDHREFVTILRVENRATGPVEVTVRLFLAAVALAANRRMWVELDKFRATLAPGRNVLYRPAALAAVIRKPAARPPSPPRRTGTDPRDNYCECGWPYNLLLPRGTRQGLPVRLFAMLTDWTRDRVEEDSCGSMSFCGARDRYPDARAMGYPFDRPFPPSRSIAQTITAQDNMATRDITIRWVDSF